MRPWRALWCLFLSSCALTDFRVGSASAGVEKAADDGPQPDAGQSVSAPRSGMAAKAQPECLSCADSECKQQRAACGDECDTLAWPISPALVPTPHSTDYVRCLASKCDAECNVLWGCVGAYSWAEPHEAYQVSIRVANPFRDDETLSARVTACQGSDPGCGLGSGMASTSMTDASGIATLTLDSGFASVGSRVARAVSDRLG